MSKKSISLTAVGLVGLGLLFSGLSSNVMAAKAALSPMQEKVKQAMGLPARKAAEIKRDHNRSPIEAMAFWGLKDDMKVIELVPASGWYTKLLAPLLREHGQLYLVSYQRYLRDVDDFIFEAPYNKTKKQPIAMDWDFDNRHYLLNTDSFGLENVDMVLNIREYHNFTPQDKVKLNKAAFDALKPGGTYVIVDHTRRSMAPQTAELWRREDPVKVILQVQAAGFVLARSSDMFYRPDDTLMYEVGRKSVSGNTDRFTLVFKKPQ